MPQDEAIRLEQTKILFVSHRNLGKTSEAMDQCPQIVWRGIDIFA
jgi:hypothetical protein